MLKKHKNGFKLIVERAGLDPALFIAREASIDGRHAFVLKLRDSKLRFIARNADTDVNKFDLKHTDYGPKRKETPYWPERDWTDIETVYTTFDQWLKRVVIPYLEEESLPDLWTRLEEQKSLIAGEALRPEDAQNFSDLEKKQLREAISRFQELTCEAFRPGTEQIMLIEDRLKYLSDGLERLNRFDWKSLAIGTLVTIAVALSLDTEKGRILLRLFMQVVEHVTFFLQ